MARKCGGIYKTPESDKLRKTRQNIKARILDKNEIKAEGQYRGLFKEPGVQGYQRKWPGLTRGLEGGKRMEPGRTSKSRNAG